MEHLVKHKTIKPYQNKLSLRKHSPFFSPLVIQPKLTINQPNDIYEQEADAVAEKVMRMPSPETTTPFFAPKPIATIQRKCAQCEDEEKLQNDEEEPIQLKANKDFDIQRKCAECAEEERNQQKNEEPLQLKSANDFGLQRKCAECEEEEKKILQKKQQ